LPVAGSIRIREARLSGLRKREKKKIGGQVMGFEPMIRKRVFAQEKGGKFSIYAQRVERGLKEDLRDTNRN